MINKTISALIALALGAAITASDSAAQDAGERRGPEGRVDVERIMSMREDLGLTDAQLEALENWRGEVVQERADERARVDDLRSRLRAGQIERSEVMAYMEERRDAMEGRADQARNRLEGILQEGQIETLEDMRMQRRAFARGRASAARGGRPGLRGQRPGGRGDGQSMRGERPGGRPGIERPHRFRDAPDRGPRGDRGGPGAPEIREDAGAVGSPPPAGPRSN